MKKFTFLAVIGLIVIVGLAGACSSGSDTTNTTKTNQVPTNTSATNSTNTANTAPKKEEDVPASVKAAFPDAQSFSKSHKDIPKDAIAGIEKDSGAKIPDTDHHSYLAFSTTGGARKQIGAATIVKAGGKELVVIYDSKNGSPSIKEVRGDIAPEFLKQFAGKGHDDKFTFGGTIKANGVDEATAKAITSAIAVDMMTMQILYGAAHSH